MITFYLDFTSSGHGKRDINEPTSFDGAEFVIEQEENRLGRDVSGVTGGTSRLRLNSLPEHCFEIIQYNFDRFGFEADVKLGVRISDTETIIGQIDFNTFQTDGKSYVEFVVTEVGERALIKRRYDATTNLFSYTTIDDEETDPVQTSTVWRPAKPIINISEWETPAGGGQSASVSGLGGEGSNVFKYFNFSNVVKRYDIGNTLGYLQGDGEANDFGYLEAKENLQDIVVTISNLTYTLAGTGNGEGRFRLKYFIGTDDELTDGYGQGEIIKFHNMVDDGNYGETEAAYTIEIPFIERGKKLYIYFVTLTQSATNLDTYGFVTTIETMNVGITATEVGYSTIIEMVRLRDAMGYVINSASGLPVSAPRWEFGGEFYDQWITTQALMRNLTDKPFNLSFKDIVEDYLPEVYGDYQLQEDGTVFFGIEADFYKDFLMESFTNAEQTEQFGQPQGQIDEFVKSVNQKLSINIFRYGYSTYSSKRENEQANTYDLVHGDTEFVVKNMLVNGSKEVKIGFIRDAFLWEEAGRKAYNLKDDTAAQDDDKKFIGDVVEMPASERFITETSTVQHKAPDSHTLVLSNDQSFSWTLLGIIAGSPFTINNGVNQGSYIVTAVNDLELTLLATNDPQDIDEFGTNYTYFIMPQVTGLKLRTYEGFDLIENIEEGRDYINLKFTPKRNILNYYQSLLASATLRTTNKVIKNTLYKNNPEATTQYDGGEIITEGADFTPENPILDIYTLKVKLLLTFSKFLLLRSKIRQFNGYILTFDSNGLPVKGFIKKGVFKFVSKGQLENGDILAEMETDLEIKYEPFLMTIFGTGGGIITINDTISVTNFEPRSDKFENILIFDGSGKQMHPPVPYDRIKVNNSGQASSLFELIQWLNALQA